MNDIAGSEIRKKKKLWEFPWKYRESFIIGFALLILGFIIEFFSQPRSILLPSWPTNFIIIVVFWVYFIFLNRYVKHPFVKWLSSTYAAISSITVFTFLILLMGFILQTDEESSSFISKIGLTHVTGSWPYLFTALYLMIILGLTITRRFLPVSLKNIAFFLNHGGLWLVIATASLGSADLWRMSMVLQQGETTTIARDYKSGNVYEMPFSLQLIRFSINEFPPNLGLVDNNTGTLVLKKGDKLPEVNVGMKEIREGWDITVEAYYPSAIRINDTFVSDDRMGALHAAYVAAENIVSGAKKQGWVTNGSMLYDPDFLVLDMKHSLVMTIPVPREYSSEILVKYPEGNIDDISIQVNNPATIMGWKVYQVSYDERMGKWSTISIVEVVRDPWLPVVYVGIFMILAGSLYLAWMGRMKN